MWVDEWMEGVKTRGDKSRWLFQDYFMEFDLGWERAEDVLMLMGCTQYTVANTCVFVQLSHTGLNTLGPKIKVIYTTWLHIRFIFKYKSKS